MLDAMPVYYLQQINADIWRIALWLDVSKINVPYMKDMCILFTFVFSGTQIGT